MKNNSKHFSEKNSGSKKRRWPFLIIIFILLGVMGFSGYKVISGMLNYREGEKAYENIAQSAVSETEKKIVRKINRASIDELPSSSETGTSEVSSEETVTGEVEEIEVVDLS
ncbi:MAG: hypothetical protein II713_00505, partial [Clostridia bacterium]|nr:hypothetical protein [Clostridia bacterium]